MANLLRASALVALALAGGCVERESRTCAAGLVLCASACVDLDSDPASCGRCGNSCASGHCLGGACLDVCAGGQVACGDTCVSTRSSSEHCGLCGHKCPAGGRCSGGQCIRGGLDAELPPGATRTKMPAFAGGPL